MDRRNVRWLLAGVALAAIAATVVAAVRCVRAFGETIDEMAEAEGDIEASVPPVTVPITARRTAA